MCMNTNLKIGELGVIEIWVDMQGGAHHEQQFKLVQGGAKVAGKAQTPYLQKSFQVKQNSKRHLEFNKQRS